MLPTTTITAHHCLPPLPPTTTAQALYRLACAHSGSGVFKKAQRVRGPVSKSATPSIVLRVAWGCVLISAEYNSLLNTGHSPLHSSQMLVDTALKGAEAKELTQSFPAPYQRAPESHTVASGWRASAHWNLQSHSNHIAITWLAWKSALEATGVTSQLRTATCMLHAAYCILLIYATCMLHCMLRTAYCMLHAACCIACCMLHAA